MEPARQRLLTLEELERETGLRRDEIGRGLGHGRCAWIAGSLVEGRGNAESDVDVFVHVDDDLGARTKRMANHSVDVAIISQRRVDYEYWTERTISELADRFATLPIDDPEQNICDVLAEEDAVFIQRLHMSIPLIGEADLTALRARFPLHRFRAYAIENRRHFLDDAIDDTIGFCRSGDFASALLRSRDAVRFAVDVFLMHWGQIGINAKYRLSNLRRLADALPAARPVLDSYWRFEGLLPDDKADQHDRVAEALDFCNSIIDGIAPSAN